ncbi:MAG: methyltransferase domain-containing protein [Candidatus Brocadiales bacterium]|nr:methyltransferase domain-containing protein [Candidatus Brocadiales bacterium]
MIKLLLRQTIELSTQLLCYIKRNRRIVPPDDGKEVKVNLGCGLAIAPDWINIDGSLNSLIAAWPRWVHQMFYRMSGANRYYSCGEYCSLLRDHQFIHHDLARGIPLTDQSVDFIYSSHFLEHLHLENAENLLRESFRVLKPGGIIRICVPDLAHAISLYGNGMADKKQMLSNYFFVEDKASYFAAHKYMYDFELLEEALMRAGFEDVRQCDFQKGVTPDLTKLDNREDDSLFVEALKK